MKLTSILPLLLSSLSSISALRDGRLRRLSDKLVDVDDVRGADRDRHRTNGASGAGGTGVKGTGEGLPSIGPWLWPEAKILALEVEVNATMASALLPPPSPAGILTLTDPALATVFVADYPNSISGTYKEAGILLHVLDSIDSKQKLHCPWMVVDFDVALIWGREGYGFPKKLASIDLDLNGDTVEAQVIRDGETVLSVTGERADNEVANPKPMFGDFVNTIGLAISLFQPELYKIAPLYLVRGFVDEEITAAYDVDGVDLQLPGSIGDPFEQFGFGDVLRATFYEENFALANSTNKVALDPLIADALDILVYVATTLQLRFGFSDTQVFAS